MTSQTTEQYDVIRQSVTDSQESADAIQLWLVDDNNKLRETLAELLGRSSQIRCTRGFSSATEVLSALASKTGPDVILLDIQMGQENGLDAIRSIRSLSRSTRVIMLTTFYDSQSHSRAMNDGASAFLLKRYPVEDIVDSIRRAKCEPISRLSKPRPRVNYTFAAKETTQTTNLRDAGASAQTTTATASRRRPVFIEHCLDLFRNLWN